MLAATTTVSAINTTTNGLLLPHPQAAPGDQIGAPFMHEVVVTP